MMQFVQSVFEALWHTLLSMAPYLLFGFLFAGVLSVLISQSLVERHLNRGRWLPSIKAALFGVPLPLCSCGVIPVAASLRRQGASKGATTAFLLSTPQTGVDSMLVTFSLLGLTFAVLAPLAAFASGVIAGLVITLISGKEHPAEPSTEASGSSCCSSTTGKAKGIFHRVFHHGFITLARDIAVPLTWGLLLAGLLSAIIPEDFFAGQLGSGWMTKVVMLVIGIPLYVCATASIPIAASFIVAGISPGAAFVFLMSGPATNAATITTIWKLMGKKTALVYLAVVAISALSAGAVLDQIYTSTGKEAVPMHHEMLPLWLRICCAILLVMVLIYARFFSGKKEKTEGATDDCCSTKEPAKEVGSCCSSGPKEAATSKSIDLPTRPGK